MDRRTLLKGFLAGTAAMGAKTAVAGDVGASLLGAIIQEASKKSALAFSNTQTLPVQQTSNSTLLTGFEFEQLTSTLNRLRRVRNWVGHANFCLVSFDQTISYARRVSSIGAFPPEEISFLENIFHTDASDYGFLGIKVTDDINSTIHKRDVKKVPYTGNYLFRETSLDHYKRLRHDVGKSLVLTSGVRGIPKQMSLFLAKAVQLKGDLSAASRSIAPPGYSFHASGDFDVGKMGFGGRNFTQDFATTLEYKKLQTLTYAEVRYHKANTLGVAFEPWHIKVG